MQRCPTSLEMRRRQIKITVGHIYEPTRMAKFKEIYIPSAGWRGSGRPEPLCPARGNIMV